MIGKWKIHREQCLKMCTLYSNGDASLSVTIFFAALISGPRDADGLSI